MNKTKCPTASELKCFASGDTALLHLHRIESHLETCSDCLETVDSHFDSGRKQNWGFHDLPEPLAESRNLDALVTRIQQRIASHAPTYYENALVIHDRTAPEPGDRFGRFTLIEVIGQGGMGVVYRARENHLDRIVALKVIRPGLLSKQSRERFGAESKAAAGIESDHVVAIFSAGEINDVPYIAMQYLSGESLSDRLKSGNLPDFDTILQIAIETCRGLQDIHNKGLVHRDIKPANLWLERSGRLRILDFGIAHDSAADKRITRTDQLVGSPAYMSPEQACGERVDTRSDLFSLGSVLFECMTGESPFRAESPIATVTRILRDQPPLERITHQREFAEVIGQLLSKNPEDRPQTAGEVIRRIESLKSPHPLPGQRLSCGRIVFAVLVLACLFAAAQIVVRITTRERTISVTIDEPSTKSERPSASTNWTSKTNAPSDTVDGMPVNEIRDSFEWRDDAPRAIVPFDPVRLQQQTADFYGTEVEITNSIGMQLRLIPRGEFTMGLSSAEATKKLSREEQKHAQSRGELVPHRVVLSRPFHTATTEVTYEQFAAVMPESMSSVVFRHNPDLRHYPVNTIPWNEAVQYCNRLSEREGRRLSYQQLPSGWQIDPKGSGYRLPTEAEFEFMCRAGSNSIFPIPFESIPKHAWCATNSNAQTHPVGHRKPDPFGLYDLTGNVIEYCHDRYSINYYQCFRSKVAVNPTGPIKGSLIALRGGAFDSKPLCMRPGFRLYDKRNGETGYPNVGFRVVLPVANSE